MKRATRFVVAGAIAAGVLIAGAGMAIAAGDDDDSTEATG
jgi:hypothetical protein